MEDNREMNKGIEKTQPAEPKLVDVPTFARLCGIGRTHAWKLVYAGQVPHVRIGRCVRIPVKAIDELVGHLLCA